MTERADPADPIDVNGVTDETDELFEVLAAGRRRAVLAHLRAADAPVDVDELTSAVAERERQPDWPSVRHEKWDDVGTALELSHLPAMDDADVVSYDEGEKTVDVGELTDQAWTQLDVVGRES